ncbi:MAG: cellulase family glycosylhydrolase, partial [Mycobacterium sp.]
MAGQHRGGRHRRTRSTAARRRRVVGFGTAIGVSVAFGMTPLVTAPPGHADIDFLFDIPDPASADVGDVSVALDTTDVTSMPALSGDDLFNQLIYTPIHTDIEDWIHSPLGEQVDGFINNLAGQYLIGDGAAGTATHPDGGAGGLLFGDGG